MEEQIHTKLVIVQRSFSVYLAGAGVGTGISRGLAALGAGVPCSESPSLSGSLYTAERGRFLRGKGAIAAELGNCGTEFGIV